jgi:hypothetical protein
MNEVLFDSIYGVQIINSFKANPKMTTQPHTVSSSSSLPEEPKEVKTVAFGDELAVTLIEALTAAGVEHILWGQMPLWLFGVPTIVNV